MQQQQQSHQHPQPTTHGSRSHSQSSKQKRERRRAFPPSHIDLDHFPEQGFDKRTVSLDKAIDTPLQVDKLPMSRVVKDTQSTARLTRRTTTFTISNLVRSVKLRQHLLRNPVQKQPPEGGNLLSNPLQRQVSERRPM